MMRVLCAGKSCGIMAMLQVADIVKRSDAVVSSIAFEFVCLVVIDVCLRVCA